MKRKVIQIAFKQCNERYGLVTYLYALCDDGTMWRQYGGHWDLIGDVPQLKYVKPKPTIVAGGGKQ